MTITTNIYFCLTCNEGGLFPQKITHTAECKAPYPIVEANVTFKAKRKGWNKFLHWFFSQNWSYGLSFMGGVIINSLLVPHFNLSFPASLLESFAVGCLLIGLLRDRK